eukprot:CAMPEP_0176429394 /NCGR_PEP_ID=MMETSP0127-20121128/13688_1 /TAXON_ID=938130 /ORGANISM="Platyophrya macrostoma, Strain WH" /LENGTH=348 /DNA_ID=CAMNT_0017811197 /DNA_START=37 /DNA_END=1083 /DNA_ORIENTATION=+
MESDPNTNTGRQSPPADDAPQQQKSRSRSRSGSRNRNGGRESSRSPGRNGGRRDPANKEPKANRVFVGNLAFTTSWQSLKDHMRKAGEVVRVDVFSGPNGRSRGCGLVEYANTTDSGRAIQQLHQTELDGRRIFVREDDASQAKFDRNQPRSFGERRSRSPRRDRGMGGRGGSPYRGGRGPRSPRRGSPRRDRGSPRRDRGSPRRMRSRSRSYERRRDRSYSRSRSRSPRRDRDDRRYERSGGDHRDSRRGPGRDSGRDNRDNGRDSSRGGGAKIVVKNLPWSVTWQNLKDAFREFGTVVRAEVPQDDKGRSAGYGLITFEKESEAQAAIENMNGADFGGRKIMIKMN